jgi:F-type H+-transporting ATPase subunit epsilon
MLYAWLYAGATMNTFMLNLFDNRHEQRIVGITSFVGEDASGCFGIQARHARFMTTLIFGLARFHLAEDWHYLALPGAVAYFNHNELTISTRYFLIDTDLERISHILEQQLLAEEENLYATRENLHNLEQAMLKRMLALKRKSSYE